MNKRFSNLTERPEINFSKTNQGDETNEENMIMVQVSPEIKAYFSSKTGYLQKMVTSDTTHIKTKIKLIKYGVTNAREKSGAYLFLPDGPATDLTSNSFQWFRVESNGPLRSRVCVNMSVILHCVQFYPTLNKVKNFKYPYVNVWNVVDLRQSHNFELAMHLETSIQNNDVFYTDLNGFQYIKRKTYAKLPIQGNVYPMPSGAFIQDKNTRVNLLSAQPLGVASLQASTLQVFLDRRLDQDDNRGMEQAMNDNIVTSNKFLIFFESINGKASSMSDNDEIMSADFQSLPAQWLSNDLLNPIVKLVLNKLSDTSSIENRQFLSVNKTFPCDLRLINMRTMQKYTNGETVEPLENEVGLIFHRVPYEDCPSAPFIQLNSVLLSECINENYNQYNFGDLFNFKISLSTTANMKISKSLLTLTSKLTTNEEDNLISKNDPILNYVQPMQIEAFRVKFN